MIIKNTNGNDYFVIDKKNNYILIKNINDNDNNKYVVAYNYDYNYKIWQQGFYFNNLAEAQTYFNTL